jgi:hypothetical protein
VHDSVVHCRCNTTEFICIPEPVAPGTPCGDGDSFVFEMCNQGPGFCSAVESEDGDIGVCVGIPTVGASCNDYEQCTRDDECTVVTTDDGFLQGVCSGTFDADLPCEGGGPTECSSAPRYGLLTSSIA